MVQGNPLALREAYRARVLAGLPDLLFLDGVDLRQPPAATPPPDPAPAPARGRKPGAGRAAAQLPGAPAAAPPPAATADASPELEAPSVAIRLEVSGLKLVEALLTSPPPGQSGRAAHALAPQAPGAGGEPGMISGKSASAPSAARSTAAGSSNPGLTPKPVAAGSHSAAAAPAASPMPNAAEAAHAGPLEPDQAREAAAWRCHVEVAGPGCERAASLPLLVGAAAAPAEASKGKAAGGRAGKAVQQAGKGADGGVRPAAERAQVRSVLKGLNLRLWPSVPSGCGPMQVDVHPVMGKGLLWFHRAASACAQADLSKCTLCAGRLPSGDLASAGGGGHARLAARGHRPAPDGVYART